MENNPTNTQESVVTILQTAIAQREAQIAALREALKEVVALARLHTSDASGPRSGKERWWKQPWWPAMNTGRGLQE